MTASVKMFLTSGSQHESREAAHPPALRREGNLPTAHADAAAARRQPPPREGGMSPATRAHRTTPPPEPPATAILNAAAAVAEVRGAHHLTQRLDQLIRELRPRSTP